MGSKKRKGLAAKADNYQRRVEKYVQEERHPSKKSKHKTKKRLALDENPEMRALQVESELCKRTTDVDAVDANKLEEQFAQEHETAPFVDIVTIAQPLDMMREHPSFKKVSNSSEKHEIPSRVFGIGGLDTLETFLTSCEELRDKTFNRGGHEVRDIPQVSRQDYQQTFFVPHGLASQQCINGTLCVGFKCFGDFLGQPLMRYYAPDEMKLLKDNTPVASREQSCRLCEIFAIHSLVMHSNMKIYNINYQLGRSIPKVGIGEYDESCVLKAAQYASNGLFGPQLSFNLNDYKPVYGVTTVTSPTVISKFVVPDEREAFQNKYPNAFLVPGLMDCSPGLVNVTTYASSLIDRPPPINPYTVCVRRPEQSLTPRLPIHLYFRARGYDNLALVFRDFEQLMLEEASVLESCYAYLEREGIVRLERFGYHAEKSAINFDTQKFYVVAFLSVSVYCNSTEKRTSRVNTMLRSLPEYVSTHLETVYRSYTTFFNHLRNMEISTGNVTIPTDEYLRTTYTDQHSLFSQFSPKYDDYYANVQELNGLDMVETTYKNPTPLVRLLQFYKADTRAALHTIAVPEWKRENAIDFLKRSELFHRGAHLIDASAVEVRTFLARENTLFEQLKREWPYVLDEFDETLKAMRKDVATRERILRCYDILSVLPSSMRDYAQDKGSEFWNAHRILFTLAYRVFVCQTMYRIEKRSVPARQAWILLMNSHLDLCLYMNGSTDMSDAALTDRHDKIVEDATIKLPDYNSPYRFYYPYSYRERTPGDMPNYVNRLNRITWSNVQQVNSKISFEAIGFKVTRRCCENRDLNKHLIEACYESAELRDYILRSLSLSMKGLYDWCTNAPAFQIMLEIHAMFEHHHVPSNFERAMRFISRCTFKSDTGKTKEYLYQNLCTNAMAENMYYMLQFNLPLMHILRKLYPYWFFDDVIELMNLARMQNDYSVEAVTRVFKTLKREDRGVYRFVHQSFVDFYLKCSHEFGVDNLKRKSRPFTLEEQEQIVNYIVDRMPLDYSDIDFNSFKLLGCSARSIEALIRIHLKHQNILNCKRNPDSKQTQNLELGELFSEIEFNDRRAFDCFFNTLLKRKNISVIKIWSDWFVNKQISQLERNFNDKITEPMTSLAVAPCCDLSVRTVCPEAFGTPTVGTKSTSYDTCSKQVICDKKSHRNVNAKPREPVHFYPAIGNIIQIKRTITGVTKEKKKPAVTSAQPVKPPKPRLQSPITLQPCCSNFGTLRTENFSPTGEYLCDLCRKHSKNHQSFEKPSCIGCGESILKNNAVKLNERFQCTTCMRVVDTEACIHCGESARFVSVPATRMAMFVVVMDKSASHELINAYLCKTCYSPWQGCGLQVFVYSALKIVAHMDTSSAKKDMVERFCRGL